MKKKFLMVLTAALCLQAMVPAFAAKASDTSSQIIEHMVAVNQQIGIVMTAEQIKALEHTIEHSAQRYSETYNITLSEAYDLLLDEVKTETPLSNNMQTRATNLPVTLPEASTGALFFIDSDTAWNHIGLYTSATAIVEAMPEDGVQYWPYDDQKAEQVVLVNENSVNDSCILTVNTTSTRRAAAAAWPKANVPAGTPYDYDFLQNKDDYDYDADGELQPESLSYNCSELVWKAYNKTTGLDLDSNGGLAVYPNNIKDSDLVSVSQGNWWS